MSETTTFAELCKLPYKDQGIFFLNGFWSENIGESAEDIWNYCKHFVKLGLQSQPPRGEDGCELDAFWSAKYFEDMCEAMTASERKESLKKADQDSNGCLSFIEFLVWKYDKSPEATLASPQGEDTKGLQLAQEKMDAVARAIEDLLPKLESAKQAAIDSKAAEAAAKEAAAAAKVAENAVRAAEAELQAAVDDLKAQEDAYASKIADLEGKANDESSGTVKRGKAANELEQLKSEDPLPLRKAKITQEAALKKVQKQRVKAEEATATANTAAQAAEQATRDAEAAQAELEKAYVDLEEKLEEARLELEEVKKRGGPSQGNFWWMGRKLYEADESLPRSKQKYDHSKPFVFVEA